jgi:hypothetical protein
MTGRAEVGADSSIGSGCGVTNLVGTLLEARTIGSAAGPTWAGATELALSAAMTSSAEREEDNMDTVIYAVKRP